MLIRQIRSTVRAQHWIKYFLKSTLAIVFYGIAVGPFFLPREFVRLQAEQEMLPFCCAAVPDGSAVISIFNVFVDQTKESGISRQLISQSLDNNRTPRRFHLPEVDPICMALDPLGDRIFVGDALGEFFCVEPAKLNQPVHRLASCHCDIPNHMTCTPDGTTLFVLDSTTLNAWDISRMPETPRWKVMNAEISCFAISADSKFAICAQTQGRHTHILEFNVFNGVSRLLIELASGPLRSLLMSANARYIACLEESGRVVLLEYSSEHEQWFPYASHFANSDDSKFIAFAPQASILISTVDDGHRLIAWDLERREILQEFDKQPGVPLGCCFLNDGRFLTWNWSRKARLWDLRSKTPVREIRH